MTKDEVVEQIDTVLHTDFLNEVTRNQVIKDLNGLVQLPADIVRAIQATAENEGSNFLDNLVGTLRNTDANLIKYQEMNKQYKELQNLPDELKAENSKKLATDMANAVKSTYGIEDDVEIVINFTNQPKGSEMAAFVREDGKIEIYLNVKEVDVSDMEQVYNALGAELNHYNPSNPYVYNKTEQQAGKNNILEEDFTSIGRKPLDGSGNSFYNDILSGSSVLESGNIMYGGISEEYLDFSGGSMCGNNVMYCNEKLNKINKDVNTLSLEEFNKKYMQEWSKVDNLLMNEVAADKNTNNIKNTGKNIIVNNEGKTINSSKKNNVKDCDDKCQTDFTDSLNSIGIENSQEKYSYYPPYRPEMEEANYEFRGVLANAGLVLVGSGVPVGGILVVPKALDYLGGSIYSFQDGDIEGGIENLAGLATLGIFTGSLYQNYGTSLTQAKDQSNGKVFHGNGQYYLDNGTSVVGVSGDNVGRINFVNGIPNNYYGVVDGKFVMGNITSGNGLVSIGSTTTVLEITSSVSTNAGLLVNTPAPKGIIDLYGLNLQLFAEKSDENAPLINAPYIRDGKAYGRPTLTGKKKLKFEQTVYDKQVDPDGILRDPNIGEIIPWKPGEPRKGIVDFGHNSGSSYKEIFEKYRTREITLDELKDFQFNPDNYRLETPSANRSHEYE